jgi:hypothetical protein
VSAGNEDGGRKTEEAGADNPYASPQSPAGVPCAAPSKLKRVWKWLTASAWISAVMLLIWGVKLSADPANSDEQERGKRMIQGAMIFAYSGLLLTPVLLLWPGFRPQKNPG